ncbi:MAG: hypothetical protein ACJ761_07975 [Chloroflexota bacterium]
MAVQLLRPDRVIVRSASAVSAGPSDRRTQRIARTAVEALVRSLLIGIGIGVTISMGEPRGVVGIATVGILAIGAALASWDT